MRLGTRRSMLFVFAIAAGVLLAGPGGLASAQDSGRAADDPNLTIDQLLGLEERGLERDRARDLDELISKLAGEAIGEAGSGGADPETLFLQAVDHMNESTVLLRDKGQAGLPTQRQQEEAIRKLDILISLASEQQQSGQPDPSGSQNQQQDPGSSQGQQANQNNPGTGENRSGDHRPPLKQTDLDGALDESGSEWGNLPPRIRDLLRQGRIEASARLYRRLTEAYYRKLAEEDQP